MKALFGPAAALRARLLTPAVSTTNTRLRKELPSLLVLGLVPSISSLAFCVHVPSLNQIASEFRVDQFSVQSTVSVYMLVYSLSIFASAFLSDMIGKRKVLLTALLVSMIGSLLATFSWSFDILMVARVLQAMASGFIMVSPYAILQEVLFGRALIKAIAVVSVMHSAAFAITPFTGGLFAMGPGWRAGFLMMAILALIVFVAIFKSLKPNYIKRYKPLPKDQLLKRAYALVNRRQFLACLVILSACSALYFGVVSVAPLLLVTQFRLTETICGFVLFCLSVFWAIGNQFSARWMQKYGLSKALQMAVLMICIGMIPMLFAPTPNMILFVTALIPYMIGAGIVAPLAVLGAARSDPALSGLASSLVFAFQVLVGSFSSWLFGFFELSSLRDIALFGLFSAVIAYLFIKHTDSNTANQPLRTPVRYNSENEIDY